MAKKAYHLMAREEIVNEYDRVLKKVNNLMTKMNYHDRINNTLYNSYVKQLDAMAQRIKELDKKQDEEHTRTTS